MRRSRRNEVEEVWNDLGALSFDEPLSTLGPTCLTHSRSPSLWPSQNLGAAIAILRPRHPLSRVSSRPRQLNSRDGLVDAPPHPRLHSAAAASPGVPCTLSPINKLLC